MERLRLFYRLSLAYWALWIAFVAAFSLIIKLDMVSDTGAGLLGTVALAGFLLLGLPLVWALARLAQRTQPVWVYLLLYIGLAFLAGVGSWGLLAYLTYRAHQKLQAS